MRLDCKERRVSRARFMSLSFSPFVEFIFFLKIHVFDSNHKHKTQQTMACLLTTVRVINLYCNRTRQSLHAGKNASTIRCAPPHDRSEQQDHSSRCMMWRWWWRWSISRKCVACGPPPPRAVNKPVCSARVIVVVVLFLCIRALEFAPTCTHHSHHNNISTRLPICTHPHPHAPPSRYALHV